MYLTGQGIKRNSKLADNKKYSNEHKGNKGMGGKQDRAKATCSTK